jgi:undecaprenyl-diphosphatase
MNIFGFIIAGAIQGIFEWLPVSSKGQVMIALINIFHISPSIALDYSIYLHIGTLIAATIYFRKELKKLLGIGDKEAINKIIHFKFTEVQRFYLLSIIFTFLIAVPIYFILRAKLDQLNVMLITLIVGILLILTGAIQLVRKKQLQQPKLSNSNAVYLGLGQGFCIIPGVSRSGISTSILLVEGFKPEEAFKHSFILSVPVILIAEVGLAVINGFSYTPGILLGVLSAGIIGYLTIDVLLRFAKKINFAYFCFVIGAIYVFISFV